MNILGGLTHALSFMGIFWTAIIFSASVFIHEFAHYWAAKRQGVAVPTFSIGMGPVLYRKTWNDTEWCISALPLGGYVLIDGMESSEDIPHGYALLSPWRKIFILGLAPLTNLLVAFVLLTSLYHFVGISSTIDNQIAISRVLPGSRAEKLGLQAGDVITAIDGQPIPMQAQGKPGWQTLASTLQRSGHHSLKVVRGAQYLNVGFDWQATVKGQPQKLGVAYGPVTKTATLSVPAATTRAGQDMLQAVPRTFEAIKSLLQRMLSFNVQPDNGIMGPVGIAQTVTQAAQIGTVALISIAMSLNMGLGIMNLMPIPGLDGGHILLIVLGMLRGRPLSTERYEQLTLVGMGLLLFIGLFVFVRDLIRIGS